MTITLQTRISRDAAIYVVRHGDDELWRREVALGPSDRHQPGGPAFVEAAREQERIAQDYAAALGQTVAARGAGERPIGGRRRPDKASRDRDRERDKTER